jgi:uncharacterized protein YbjQ (UPF0145 family)
MWTGQASMLVATLPAIEGRPIQWYLGIVTGESILDADRSGEAGDGARACPSSAFGLELRKARDSAIETMLNEAAQRGANAVIGVDLGYQPIEMREQGVVLMVSASGTAVRI